MPESVAKEGFAAQTTGKNARAARLKLLGDTNKFKIDTHRSNN